MAGGSEHTLPLKSHREGRLDFRVWSLRFRVLGPDSGLHICGRWGVLGGSGELKLVIRLMI